MSQTVDRLDSRLASLLSLGTWASCVMIALGLALPLLGLGMPPQVKTLVPAGIVLMIALPVIRVAAMGLWFLAQRERDFALIAALVLATIVASTLLGATAA